MNRPIALASSGVLTPIPDTHRTIRYTDDAEILAMGDEEYLAAIDALGGAWSNRDDISDHWLEEIRGEWDKRLGDLYGVSDTSSNPPF
jgi:hypothetical protein